MRRTRLAFTTAALLASVALVGPPALGQDAEEVDVEATEAELR